MSDRREIGLFLDGLRCAGCVARVERELRAVAGVDRVAVNFTTHRALVHFDPDVIAVEPLCEHVRALGYEAIPYDPESLERPAQRQARAVLTRVLVAGFLAGNVMMIALALYLGQFEGSELATRRALRGVAIALSLPAVTWCAWPFWQAALAGLRHGRITIDLPIALGIGTAFATQVAGTWADSDHVFVDSAAVIVFLILLGRSLERSARARAAGAVERLAALTPARALRRRGESLEEVPAAELCPGDVVVVAPGQNVPADGVLIRGASELDESLLTGESHPVARQVGDLVTGGTRNTLAQVEVEVRARADGGTLARMAALLERAQAERPAVQRLADRVAAVFAPSVLVVAGATALVRWGLGAAPLDVAMSAAAVLIVACPCALGLATPAAVTAAVGRAARLGVLVKSGEAFERCARARSVVLDKTGTLTWGRLHVEAIETAPGFDADELLALAAAAEGAAPHPVARAIARAADARGLAVPALASQRAVAGRGVEVQHGGARVRVGSWEFACEQARDPDPALREAAAKHAERGLSLAWVALGERVAGAIALLDEPREDAARAVARLQRLGLDVSLVSGDHADAVALAAREAGIENWASGVTPDDKVARVRDLRAAGARPIAVGDGVNDAAALAAAEVGLAMARGSDVTLHAADLVIRSPRLAAVPDTVALARATLRRIRENLGFAVCYNAVAVPLAAAGWLSPLHAAIAMSLSSVVVTLNAIRLLRWRATP